jgi:hypothetical protein
MEDLKMNRQSQWLFEAPFVLESDRPANPYNNREYYSNSEWDVDWEEQKIFVKDWIKSLSVPIIKVTASATPDNVAIQGPEKVNPLPFDRPVRMWIRAGDLEQDQHGKVGLNLNIEYQGTEKIPRSSKVARERFAISSLMLPFECTAEGNIRLTNPPNRRRAPRPGGLSVDIEVYQRRDKPKNSPMRDIPSSVWNEWMTKLSILRIVVIVKLTASENGPSWYSVDVKDESVPIPTAINVGSTGTHTALLGPMTIDLVPEDARPPITAPQGILWRVYFGRDSFEIDKIVDEGPDGRGGRRRVHQGNALDAWIRNDLFKRWDVRTALYFEELPVRGEARASATLKGKSGAELLRYNQVLSEKRLDAVVNRLKRTIRTVLRDTKLDTTQMRAIGASQANVLGEETVNERRCDIRISGADLEKAMKKIYRVPHRWWWDR